MAIGGVLSHESTTPKCPCKSMPNSAIGYSTILANTGITSIMPFHPLHSIGPPSACAVFPQTQSWGPQGVQVLFFNPSTTQLIQIIKA